MEQLTADEIMEKYPLEAIQLALKLRKVLGLDGKRKVDTEKLEVKV